MSFQTFDTAQTGIPVTATGQVFNFGAPVTFYLTLASYIVQGQGTGPVAIFQLLGGKDSGRFVTVNYGDVSPPQKFNATTLICTSITGSGSVQVRVIISAEPQPLSPTITGIATTSGAGSQTIISSQTTFNSGLTNIYTVPAKFRLKLHGIILLFIPVSSGSGSFGVLAVPNGLSNLQIGGIPTIQLAGLWLAAALGLSVTSPDIYVVAAGIGPSLDPFLSLLAGSAGTSPNTQVWGSEITLAAGDSIWVSTTQNLSGFVFALGILEPL